jgi:hypothetical protein
MSEGRDPLEQALSGSAYVEDGGFTDGVLEALPPRRAPRRAVPVLAAGVIAAVFGAVALGETVASAAAALGTTGAVGFALLGAAAAAAAGAIIREGR